MALCDGEPGPGANGSDLSGEKDFTGPLGGIAYTAHKTFAIYCENNPDNPLPLAGNYTYVYQVSHLGGIGGILAYELEVPSGLITGAGWIDDPADVTPTDVTIQCASAISPCPDGDMVAVKWGFFLSAGQRTDVLYVHSSLGPCSANDNLVSFDGQFALDTFGTCIGPRNCLEISKQACVIQPPDSSGDQCEGKLISITLQYTGEDCSASSHLQDPKKVACVGDPAFTAPVDIEVKAGKTGSKKKKGKNGKKGKKGKNKRQAIIFTGVIDNVGDEITVTSLPDLQNFKSETTIELTDPDNVSTFQTVTFHTSCSQPLGIGMQFGAFLVTGLTSSEGGTAELPDVEDCVTEFSVTPPPHCDGKVEAIEFRYSVADCNASLNSQGDKAFCDDGAPATTLNDVEVTINDGGSITSGIVSAGDRFVVTAAALGNTKFGANTTYSIEDVVTNDVVQSGGLHTSCSKPLNLGDQFGALQIFGLDTTEGGTVALSSDVEYDISVTNICINAVDVATNVTVTDPLFNPPVLASGISIAPGETVSFEETVEITEETTNTVTVTSSQDTAECEGCASATVTPTQPETPGQECTSKIAAFLIEYRGPDVAGPVTVEISPKASGSVFYDLPGGLTSGIQLTCGTDCTTPGSESGFSVNGRPEDRDLGSQTTLLINGQAEVIHTSCSAPFVVGAPAPLNNPKGAPSSLWHVVDFEQKN